MVHTAVALLPAAPQYIMDMSMQEQFEAMAELVHQPLCAAAVAGAEAQ